MNCLIKEIVTVNLMGNPTFISTQMRLVHKLASYLYLYWWWGQIEIKRQMRWDDFNLPVLNFLYTNIPAAHVYVDYISQVIRYFMTMCILSGLFFCWRVNYLHRGSWRIYWNLHIGSCTVAIMNWLTARQRLSQKWPPQMGQDMFVLFVSPLSPLFVKCDLYWTLTITRGAAYPPGVSEFNPDS